jgi:hypothetical protein
MSEAAIDKAAGLLVAVRRGGPRLANLGATAPTTEAASWAVQRAVLGPRV